MTSAEESLRSCPFCGGEPERYTIGDEEPDNSGGDVICCKRCGASSHVEFGRKENLVSCWNQRVSDAELLESLTACRDAANELGLSSSMFPREQAEAAIARARGTA